jgi:hypothetical protein
MMPNTALQRSDWLAAILASRFDKAAFPVYCCATFQSPAELFRWAALSDESRYCQDENVVADRTLLYTCRDTAHTLVSSVLV